jgi:formyltetrahydrofolate-dependent phosphoribosylglycinamide formyltransferase
MIIMDILILGSGAREDALYSSLSKDNDVYIYDGNDVIQICKDKRIDLVVVGPEKYLVDGIVDELNEHNIMAFGPSKKAAMIEGSKIFSKKFMIDNKIPTPELCHSKSSDIVIKCDGLMGGKGVYIPSSIEETKDILYRYPIEELVIEKKIIGEEISVMGFCNGHDIILMPQCQDHKRIYDDDTGPNTGGMGAYGPVSILTDSEILEIKDHMLKVVRELNFIGVLYAGLIKNDDGIFFLEFNCRFGDPETQIVLNLLQTDLTDIILWCLGKKDVEIIWKTGYTLCVVFSHLDYPWSKLSEPISVNFNDVSDRVKIYRGNVKNMQTTGGRVLSIVAYDDISLGRAHSKVYNEISKIKMRDLYYRRDIGLQELIRNRDNMRHINIAILGSSKGTSSQLLIDDTKQGNLFATIKVIISDRKGAFILDRARQENISSIYLPLKGDNKYKYDEKIVNILRAYDIDVVYLIGYSRIVTHVLIDEYKGNIFNIHPSLLPNYKGLMDMKLHSSVIKNGDKISGCTLHHVTTEIDGGDIFLQKQLLITPNMTSDELKHEIQKLEEKAIVDSVKILCNRKLNYNVDIDSGNKLVDIIKDHNKDIGGFCALYDINGMTLGAATDGVGTKIDLAIKIKKFDTIGIDLVAMSVNDLLVCGIKPLFFLDYIAVDKLDKDGEQCQEILKGIYRGCDIANCKLIGGETAEMHGIYMKNKFDLAGFAVGISLDKYPKLIEAGNYVYGIKSSGIHSNGFTLVNELLRDYENRDIDVDDFLTPTKIYIELLDMMTLYKNELQGMVHITGGGIIDNLPRILPIGLTYSITLDRLPVIFEWIQNTSGLSDYEMLKTFNCGYGIVLVFNKLIDNPDIHYLGTIINGNKPKITF